MKRADLNNTRIHTSISRKNKKLLLEYGNGIIKKGLENVIKIAESKTIEVNIITKVTI